MAFQLSPGVLVTEKDLTNIIPAVSTSTGAFAGAFVWGPVLDPTLIANENELVARFGKPVDENATSFFTAANFLSYASNMLIVRAAADGARNAVVTAAGALVSAAVTDPGNGFTGIPTVSISGGTGSSSGATATATLKVVSVSVNSSGTGWAVNDTLTVNIGSGVEATFKVDAVSGGNATDVSIVSAGNYTSISAALSNVTTSVLSSATGADLTVDVVLGLNTVSVSGGNYTVAPTLSANNTGGSGSVIDTPVIQEAGIVINNVADYTTNYENGQAAVGQFAAKYPGKLGNSIKVVMADAASYDGWSETIDGVEYDYSAQFDGAPDTSSYVEAAGGMNDELHILVIDTLGKWSGVKNGVLEKYSFLSKAVDSRRFDGSNNYYRDVINNTSKYVWWMDHPEGTTNWGSTSEGTSFDTLETAPAYQLSGGIDDLSPSDGNLEDAFLTMVNTEQYDISLVATGAVKPTVAAYIIQNLADVRRDCVAFVSPCDADGNMITAETAGEIVERTVDYRTGNTASSYFTSGSGFNVNSSYAVLDSGWKYQYDRYNDRYRWVPLNGDIAGLCARTDYTNDAWWSPGGLNRGIIKNAIRLNINPNQAQRDSLYKNGINPVVSFPGQGTVLYGDKTLLSKPSAFDRINVRRLFVVLEKAIATAAKFQLFEFNDNFTRAQFRAFVEPFLRDVQGRRGITEFRVVCNETNNTGEVIDRNEFVADIFVKPTRSINFITLNFVAARSNIAFEEIGG